MGKINFANIQSALGKAKEAAAPLQNKGHTENVPVDFIVLADKNIYNESDNDESIKELADNIEACGLLHPITVNKIGTEKYQIISGERRFRAITEHLHWKSVPCMVFEGLSDEAAQLKLCMANLAVREYTTSQKYKFYLEVKALLEKMKASGEYQGGLQKGIAAILNVTERQVKKYYQLEKLPEEIQKDVLDGKVSINRALERLQKESIQSETSDQIENVLGLLVGQLSESQREMIMSGRVDLSSLFAEDRLEKGEPVPLLDASMNEDTNGGSSKKGEPVPVFGTESTSINTKQASKYTDSISNNTNCNNLLDFQSETEAPPSVSKSKSQHDGSVLIFKDGMFIPNKIQVIEEHENYTVFKVFAVRQ